MDRLSQLRGGAGGSGGASPGGSSAGDSFLTASDSPSKYFSLSEDDSFEIAKDVTLSASTPQHSLNEDCLISNLSPIGKKDMLDYKIGKQIEAANILSGGVDIFDDNENSYDGNELVIDDNVVEEKSPSLKSPEGSELPFKSDDQLGESTLIEDIGGSKKTEVVLQIDGKNVDAINIGNGLYLYRKEGLEELAAVQIIDDDQHQPSFKFLKVRENAEGNLEVYEEIEIEVPKEAPTKEGKPAPQSASHVPIKGINKVIADPGGSKVVEKALNTPEKETPVTTPKKLDPEISKDSTQAESVTELNLNGKMVKISESRKSPLMAYHSTPNKEGIPLTKTMVDQQLHPSRHSDNVKKTIEVHTENSKQRSLDTSTKSKEVISPEKSTDKPLVEDKKEDSAEKLSGEATIESVPTLIENKSEKVIETLNEAVKDDKQDVSQEPDGVRKAVSECKSIDTEPIIPIENKDIQKEDKDKIIVTDKLDSNVEKSGQVETIHKKNEKEIEVTASLDKPVENVISVTTIKNTLNKSDVTEVQNPEKFKGNETPLESLETPTEIIEEMEVDENPLIIEEDAIDSQTVVPSPKENEIKQLEPPAEPKSKKIVNKKEFSRSEDKPAEKLSTESKGKELRNIDKSISSTSETEETIAVEVTTEKIETNVDNTCKTAKEAIKIDNTIVKDSLKEVDKIKIAISKPEEKSDKLSSSQPPIESTDSKPVNSVVPEAKVKDPVSTSCIPQKIASKVESVPQNKQNVETKNKAVVSDVKSTTVVPNKEQSEINLPKNTQNTVKLGTIKISTKPIVVAASETKTAVNHKTELAKTSLADVKPISINNNHTAVPFGQWTEVNRQDFLNKIKESKVPVNSSNANQLKQPHDLNRRDVLKKIYSQRQTYKVQESLQKTNVKTETAFASKTVAKQETKPPEKTQAPLIIKAKPAVIKKPVQETIPKAQPEPIAVSSTTKQEKRKEINNQELIDKTVEDMISRAVTGKGSEDVKQIENEVTEKVDKKPEQVNKQNTLLDAIEIQMNELHGIPFVERPPHELPRPTAEPKLCPKKEALTSQKVTQIPNLLPLSKTQQKIKDCQKDMLKKEQEKIVPINSKTGPKPESNATKKEKIITEKEFDRFARRNSVTYENCLTVTDTQQVIQTVVPREAPPKKISRNEQMLAEAKAKSPHKHPVIKQYQPSRGSSKYVPEAPKQYHSKLHMAYQTALTAKRRDSPITIIEDKPVKVVFMEPATEFTHLDVQGRDLSPAKRTPDPDTLTVETCDSLDSDILDAIEDIRAHEETKAKSKHQRKQVLTPVENPDLELIEPRDLGIDVSPKKKRRTEPEKSLKSLVPKKSYLLGRSAPRTENISEPQATAIEARPNPVTHHNDAVSAIDNLVKAAELLENQSESLTVNTSVQSVDTNTTNTPVKRGRGRPRKNPLPDGAAVVTKGPSPQKRPRLIDAKPSVSSSDESSDDEALIKENWTMGKINENIVCPICSKLFRSENVVFKHVKHCTGPSPSRSETGRQSPRASREDRARSPAETLRKRKSKDSAKSTSSDDVAAVETTKPKETEKEDKMEPQKDTQKTKPKLLPRNSNLVCEICGKSFRQLSYLVSHKLQHKKDETKKAETDKSIFSCETCKKEFRKLHHLVQHRLIHNPAPSRPSRKTSSEQKDVPKAQEGKLEDQSAGFRCEPCDKSFRKLHHLVEHRETHDGINRQRSNSVTQVNPEKQPPPPQCDICKKTFRKLHHLIEHKEQHGETSSEKSDDQKSVKSALSTRDIIHECNLCYMVFPNEHSLTKHTVICLRKKRQSAAKQAAAKEEKAAEEGEESKQEESKVDINDDSLPIHTEVIEEETKQETETKTIPPTKEEVPVVKEDLPKPVKEKSVDKSSRQSTETKVIKKVTSAPENPPPKASKTVETPKVNEVIVIEDTPKKKVPAKERWGATLTKRQKIVTPALAVTEPTEAPPSEEDEVRYMLNPDFKVDESVRGKNFMKVRAKKRSSLQIERPNSKDLTRRRSLLQHAPKIPRLRSKSDDAKVANPNPPKQPVKPILERIEVPSTDSDDSDVKYSFPKTIPEKPAQNAKEPVVEKEKTRRKTMAEKRKSLVGIAKRKSLGKAIAKPSPAPGKTVKRRTMAAEHRCDCGQLFSSAALLARHATLAHTPPRLRRERKLIEPPTKQTPKIEKKTPNTEKKTPNTEKKTPKTEKTTKTEKKTPKTIKKTPKTTDKNTRNRAHTGVPLPEKRPKK